VSPDQRHHEGEGTGPFAKENRPVKAEVQESEGGLFERNVVKRIIVSHKTYAKEKWSKFSL
jgi:hypothetical protein